MDILQGVSSRQKKNAERAEKLNDLIEELCKGGGV